MKNEKGFSLIEVMIAIALLGIIAIAFLGALSTGSKAIFIADKQATAESLARTEMEYVKSQDYIDYSEDPHDVYDTISTPTGYSVNFSAVPFDPDTGLPYSQVGGIFEQDDGIQKITVKVDHQAQEVIILEGYKTLR